MSVYSNLTRVWDIMGVTFISVYEGEVQMSQSTIYSLNFLYFRMFG